MWGPGGAHDSPLTFTSFAYTSTALYESTCLFCSFACWRGGMHLVKGRHGLRLRVLPARLAPAAVGSNGKMIGKTVK